MGWSLGTRFIPVADLLTCAGEAGDWGTGLSVKSLIAQEFNRLDKMNHFEVYYIVTRAWVCVREARRDDVNASANFCFLTKDTNRDIATVCPKRMSRSSKLSIRAHQTLVDPDGPHFAEDQRVRWFLRSAQSDLAAERNLGQAIPFPADASPDLDHMAEWRR